MNIEVGYACLNQTLMTQFKAVTLKTLEKLNLIDRIEKLNSIALNNINLVDEILKFNNKNNIMLYRIPTNLLPFPTHPIAKDWNWRQILLPCFKYTGRYIEEFNSRISFHADEYTIINSPNENVFINSMESLIYLSDILDMLNIDGSIVVHVGGVYENKTESLKRFTTNYYRLPEHIRVKLIIENDDKQYSWLDAYNLCEKLKLPHVLDIHHYKVYNPNNPLTSENIKQIFSTWHQKKPKIHLSSPKNPNEPRAHADYINIEDFVWFYRMAKEFDYDIMLEAKAKELAVFKFRNDFKELTLD